MSSETLALIAIIVVAASECIALNPKLRSNSVIQLVLAGLSSAFPRKNDLSRRRSQGRPPLKKEENKFEWADEGVSTLVRVIILGWAGAILTLNYVTIPGIPQKNIDPTFIASVFTGTLATFGVVPAKEEGR